MPSTNDELRAKFTDYSDAWFILEKNGFKLDDNGVISKPHPEYKPTEEEWDSIQYMIEEWDFGLKGLPPN